MVLCTGEVQRIRHAETEPGTQHACVVEDRGGNVQHHQPVEALFEPATQNQVAVPKGPCQALHPDKGEIAKRAAGSRPIAETT